jgi:prepilin-type N-terminal cleavage/methylation domain-containing protein
MTTRTRGYTIVELMMALTVLAIGVSGVIAMQKVTVASNQHAKNLAIATHVAESWAEQLEADAVRWNYPSPSNGTPDLTTDTVFISQGVGSSIGKWIRPDYDANAKFGAAFDALGNVIPEPGPLQQTVFCTNIRLTWLYPETSFNGLLRADIRVFWPREGRGRADTCSTVSMANVNTAITDYHFVYHSTAIRQHTAFP